MYLHFQLPGKPGGSDIIPAHLHKYKTTLDKARFFGFAGGHLLSQWHDVSGLHTFRIWLHHFKAPPAGLSFKVSSNKRLDTLLYILNGEAVLQLPGKNIQLKKGKCYLLHLGSHAQLQVQLQGSFSALHIDLEKEHLMEMIATLPDADLMRDLMAYQDNESTSLWYTGSYNFEVHHCLRDLLFLPPEPQSNSILLYTSMLYKLMNFFSQQLDRQVRKAGDNEQLHRDVETFITTHMDQADLIQQLQKQYKKSRRSLERALGKGYCLAQSIRERRLHKAAELLRQTSRTVSEIAGDVGMPNHISFTRSFRRYYHMSPTAYRQQHSIP